MCFTCWFIYFNKNGQSILRQISDLIQSEESHPYKHYGEVYNCTWACLSSLVCFKKRSQVELPEANQLFRVAYCEIGTRLPAGIDTVCWAILIIYLTWVCHRLNFSCKKYQFQEHYLYSLLSYIHQLRCHQIFAKGPGVTDSIWGDLAVSHSGYEWNGLLSEMKLFF